MDLEKKDDGASAPERGEWLVGGGRMGELIRSTDWSSSPLGPRGAWPQSLRTTINLCLASNFPLCFTWGPSRVQIYNDGYWPVCGAKHPHSMGQDYRECWFSAWPVIGPGFERCMETGETTFVTDTRMFLDRNGYLEETFFTYSYSPIRDETGGIGGIFHPVTETTHLVLAERRLSALRSVAAATADSKTVDETLSLAALALDEYPLDLPFVSLYRLHPSAPEARLAGSTGVTGNEFFEQPLVNLDSPAEHGLSLGTVLQSGRPFVVDGLDKKVGAIPAGPYPEPPKDAFVFPISVVGVARPLALLVAGISPRRALDPSYRQFYDLLGGALTTAVSNAHAYEEERRRAEALAELDRAKTAFFSNVSHEFRTPLTLMLGPLEDVLGGGAGAVPAEALNRVEVAHRNGLRLLKLVNTLLDFSRLEAGRMQATFAPTDLAALTTELASTFRSTLEKAGLFLDVDCPRLPEPVYVDGSAWEKVVFNLLSNAFKFTLAGRITVRQRMESDFVVLSVSDTGVGIPESEQDKVFDRFHRIEGSAGRTHEGTGIGLALVQELAKIHGGTARLESTPGTGTTVTVTLRRGSAHLAAEQIALNEPEPRASGAKPFLNEATLWLAQDEEATTEAAPGSGPRPRILLADDNADMRQYVTRLLSPHYDVRAVPDGEAALAEAIERPPALVLSDVMMPRLDGFGLLAKLRDADGYTFILGRTDDVINVAGHRLGTREIEESVATHPSVAEAAVIGVKDDLKGQVPVVFATLKTSGDASTKRDVADGMQKRVIELLGGIAKPARVYIVNALPKTRSGKLLRRSLQALAEDRDPGDLSTLDDPSALEEIRGALKRGPDQSN